MMTGTNGNTQPIEQSPHIQMMYVTYQERNYATFMCCLTKDTHTRDLFQSLHSIDGKLMFVVSYMI